MTEAPTLADAGSPTFPEPEPRSVEPTPEGIEAVARALVEMESQYSPPNMDQVRADWLWVVEQTPKKEFDRYRGLTVAVYRGQVLGASVLPNHLELEVARRLKVHPAQLVMAYIEPSLYR